MHSAVGPQPSIAYAHSLPGRPLSEWEPLEKHLHEVGELAQAFAANFNAAEWGYLLGRCHDLGKYSRAFQEYIQQHNDPDASASEGIGKRVDHSTFGARYVAERIGKYPGQLLAFCIAGHHVGLPDASSGEDSGQRGTLRCKLNAGCYEIPEVRCPDLRLPDKKPTLSIHRNGDLGFQVSFFTRMIFSCLIDADRLATEQFCDPDQSKQRSVPRPPLTELKQALDRYLADKQATAPHSSVNQVRAKVLSYCREASIASPGFFSLNVPTGGGKTLASMAFSLDHALHHNLHRVIVAIPFTSIIEQSADVYRSAFGTSADGTLVEHHTNLKPERDIRANQLGSENWDAPVVVTTNVQFFESLYAANTTPCRKLHRLSRSVIILDEAQTIPVDLLRPALAALKELVLNYGCSVVLCTATQPALEKRQDFEIGLDRVGSIIPNPETLFNSIRRVQVHRLGRVDRDDLIGCLAEHKSVLCIVNTRKEAAAILDSLEPVVRDPESCFHLSTWMCGQHRRETLGTIVGRLKRGAACRLVSTQVVEAGVDVDFPVVYRAVAGFDSIAQAAGRCNREGLLDIGQVYVFEGESLPPLGFLRDAAQAGQELANRYPDPLTPDAIRAYFELLYWSRKHAWDKYEVLSVLSAEGREPFLPLQFRDAASRFRIIRDDQTPILIPFDKKSCMMRDQLLRNADLCIPQRRLQPYLVSVHPPLLRALQEKTLIVEHPCGVWLLVNSAAYSPKRGLSAEAFGIDPSLLVI